MINRRKGNASHNAKAAFKQQVRREKSRDAARSRREKESNEITALAQSLPLPFATVSKLDKSSVIRLATGYMLCRELAKFGLSKADLPHGLKNAYDGVALEALNGFVFVVTPGGKIIYISDNVVSYLGLSAVDLCGLSIYDYLHTADAQEFSNNIRSGCTDLRSTYCKDVMKKGKWHEIFMRMKSAFYKNQSVTPKSPDYKTLRCTGRCCVQLRSSSDKICNDVRATDNISACFVCFAEPLPSSIAMDVPPQQKYFKTTFTLDLKFNHCDNRITDWTGYDPVDLYGMSLYQLCDRGDDHRAKEFHKNLILKGQCVLTNLKILAKYGGWIMIYMNASVVSDNGAPSPQRIEAVSCVIGTSSGRDITSLEQRCESLNNCRMYASETQMCFGKDENTVTLNANSEISCDVSDRIRIPYEGADVKSASEKEESDVEWLADVLDYDTFSSNPMLCDYNAQSEFCKDKTDNYIEAEQVAVPINEKEDYDDLAPFVPPPSFDNRLYDNFVSICNDIRTEQEFMPDCTFLPANEISNEDLVKSNYDIITDKRYLLVP
ncbi:Hypoxia-inducible factor 1-alpha [Trichoplax sp. H2]|nr:Hypoxia-inducible factor 1-alpha [Trichoplax sp. H2]|eukprot:RDD46842.1 Hypoxia-inducible factor 1-alpha [Trichoplax sp. H2]